MPVHEALAPSDAQLTTRQYIAALIGPQTLAAKEVLAPAIMAHNLRVGTGVYDMLETAGLPEDICRLGMAMGGLHDIGKFQRALLPLCRPSKVFSALERMSYSKWHANAGADVIRGWLQNRDDPELRYAAFAAQYHHDPLPMPTCKASTEPLSLAQSLTHVVQVYDVWDALTDPSRAYVQEREGQMTPERVAAIVLQNRAPELFVAGQTVYVHDYVRQSLGLS